MVRTKASMPEMTPRRPVQTGQGIGGDVVVHPVLFQGQADDLQQAAMLEVHAAIIGAWFEIVKK
jgi:hypothetical protein